MRISDGCDVDKAILENPFLDHAELIYPDSPLPYPDNRFDIVVARSVFEHVENPDHVARELLRVVKPRGCNCRYHTQQVWIYRPWCAMVSNRMHVSALKTIQPERKDEDVFPTRYRMNTPAALRKAFGDCADVYVAGWSSEPGYHFGRPNIYRMIKWLNKHSPTALSRCFVYIVKRSPNVNLGGRFLRVRG